MARKDSILTAFLLVATLAGTAALCWRGLNPATPPVTVLTVEPQARQTLKGWGVYPGTYQLERPNPSRYWIFDRPNAQRLIFGELGASYLRCNIYPGSYDSKRDDGSLDLKYLNASLVRYLKLARRFGHKKYILTVWSPPKAFKSPSSHLGVDPKTKAPTYLRRDREADYCRYVVRVLDYVTKVQHLPAPLAFSIQNEPGYTPTLYDGTAYSFSQWRRVTTAMRQALDKGGYKEVKVIGPDAGEYEFSMLYLGGQGAPALAEEPEFNAALDGLAFHGYSPSMLQPEAHPAMRTTAQTFLASKRDVWMTEWCITLPMERMQHTLTVAQHLGREMAYIPCNYWTWWQGWYYQHPKSEVLVTGEDDNDLHISKTYYFFKTLWHLAPAGSVVHRVTSNDEQISGYHWDEVQTVAFRTGKRTTLMVVNPTPHAKQTQVAGVEPSRMRHYLTTDGMDMALQHPSGSSIKLPAHSVSLLTWER